MGSFDKETEYQKGMGLLGEAIDTLSLGIDWLSHISVEKSAEILRQLKQIESELSY